MIAMRHADDGQWGELLAADWALNAGLPLELMSAEGYAHRDGVSREEYIIKVLRAERDKRQRDDAITGDQVMLDKIIDGARRAGVTVVDYIINGEFTSGTQRCSTWNLSPDFLAKLLTRYEERIKLTS
jgi:hypothetical protein